MGQGRLNLLGAYKYSPPLEPVRRMATVESSRADVENRGTMFSHLMVLNWDSNLVRPR
jgi:hypothetical protein